MINYGHPGENTAYIHSDGFIETSFTMKHFDDSTEEDVSGCVFRILPPFKYETQQYLLKMMEDSGANFEDGQQSP